MNPERKHITLAPPLRDRVYYEQLAETLATLAVEISGVSAPRVLDVGCGRGELLRTLASRGASPTGIDVDRACAAAARRHGPVVVADIYTLDRLFPPRSFDVVVASHVLEHVQNPQRAVSILSGLARRAIVLAVPNLLRPVNWFLRSPRHVNKGHLQGWDVHHFRTFLEYGCGLRIIRWGSDRVILTPLHWTPLTRLPGLAAFERQVLGRLFPHMRNSIIAVAEEAEGRAS